MVTLCKLPDRGMSSETCQNCRPLCHNNLFGSAAYECAIFRSVGRSGYSAHGQQAILLHRPPGCHNLLLCAVLTPLSYAHACWARLLVLLMKTRYVGVVDTVSWQ
jgi:hypothetical protein